MVASGRSGWTFDRADSWVRLMPRHNRVNERLVALFLLGVILLVPPVLIVIDRPVRVFGVPLLHLYLFAVWAGLIGAAARMTRTAEADDQQPGHASVPQSPGAAPLVGVRSDA